MNYDTKFGNVRVDNTLEKISISIPKTLITI